MTLKVFIDFGNRKEGHKRPVRTVWWLERHGDICLSKIPLTSVSYRVVLVEDPTIGKLLFISEDSFPQSSQCFFVESLSYYSPWWHKLIFCIVFRDIHTQRITISTLRRLQWPDA